MFVSYAHDPDGIRIAEAICPLLRQAGIDVVSDHGLSVLSPTSIQAWMDEKIADGIVLLVLSPGYLRAFDEERPGLKAHRGVRYELRAIRQKIYDHAGPAKLPVIPVVMPRFSAEDLPSTLRGLAIERFDPATGLGGDLIVRRVLALQGSTEGGGTMWGGRSFAQIFQELQAADPMSGRALELVKEALDRPPQVEILRGFVAMAEVIKLHCDVSAMRDLVGQCLLLLHTSPDLLPWDCELEPRILIGGKAWYLRREHMLVDAFEEAQRGIRMAECRPNQRRTVAFGKKHAGMICRLLAEEATGQDRAYYFNTSATYLQAAEALFAAIDGDCMPASEVGVCLLLQARTQLSRSRVLDDRAALVKAARLADQAGSLLSRSEQVRDFYDLLVLRAEIAAANRRCAVGKRILNEVIESLIKMPSAAYAEILARAYTARARIALAARNAKAIAMTDLRKARDIYRAHNLTYPMAVVEWKLVKLDLGEVRQLKVTQADVRELERVTTDARLRFAAIDDVRRELDAPVGMHSGKQINWEQRVTRARHRGWPQSGQELRGFPDDQ
ncbi:toll/interleukin-1 receptor domain-containing protein [Kibdelosporangium aridum]|uniref:toll/interleukin-1 receptor domain-containing protein n=1 Tax=Kibdelosporangium aridum TaxID=2030 RepID=UPI0005632151|nr:toll/interleukin-1 receptor domain-containing protein [Kibdelosporangium aridum]